MTDVSTPSGPDLDRDTSANSSQSNSKVAIPRLKLRKVDEEEGQTKKRPRTSQACQPCRQRKTKCNGQRPSCGACVDVKMKCYYEDGKRESTKKKLKELEDRVELYGTLLKEFQPKLDSASQLAIEKALGGQLKTVSESESQSPKTPALSRIDIPTPQEAGGETLASPGAGSTGSLDHITEDINTLAINHPTGYMGKVSDNLWARSIENELEAQEKDERRPQLKQEPVYHLDDQDMPLYTSGLDAFALPPKDHAEKLLALYFESVHPIFPIVHKTTVLEQWEDARNVRDYSDVSKKRLALLNLIFAISCTYYATTPGDEWPIEGTQGAPDGTLCFTRARILGALDGGSVFDHADLQRVQRVGLTGLYLLACKQINRSWNVTGLAVRFAHSLGLHLRNDAPNMNPLDREMRNRVWYSITHLEQTLCLITGRPAAYSYWQCSVPVPKILEEDNPWLFNSGTSPPADFYLASTGLSVIAEETFSRLYSPRSMYNVNKTWADVQKTIRTLALRLEEWQSNLPERLVFEERKSTDETTEADIRHRMNLALRYHNIRLVINRPCLCPIDGIENESKESQQFNQETAVACIESARKMITSIVREGYTLRLLPWWSILHYVVASQTVLMLEMVYQATHSPRRDVVLFNDARDVIEWLLPLSKCDLAAKRCYDKLSDLLARLAPRIGHVFVSVIETAPAAGAPQIDPQGDHEMMNAEGPWTNPSSYDDLQNWLSRDFSTNYLGLRDEVHDGMEGIQPDLSLFDPLHRLNFGAEDLFDPSGS